MDVHQQEDHLSALLTIGPPPGGTTAEPASESGLTAARGLLLPHDRRSWADVRGRPEAWAALQVARRAVTLGVPILAWGSGAALLARALGASLAPLPGGGLHIDVHPPDPRGLWAALPDTVPFMPEWGVPRDARVLAFAGGHPAAYGTSAALALALPALPWASLQAVLHRWEGRAVAPSAEPTRRELRSAMEAFYAAARRDDLIGPVFTQNVRDWDAHLEHVTDFWETLLTGRPAYRGNFTGAHAPLGLRGEHVRRWLELFEAACRETLGERGRPLVDRAHAMAGRLSRRAGHGK